MKVFVVIFALTFVAVLANPEPELVVELVEAPEKPEPEFEPKPEFEPEPEPEPEPESNIGIEPRLQRIEMKLHSLSRTLTAVWWIVVSVSITASLASCTQH